MYHMKWLPLILVVACATSAHAVERLDSPVGLWEAVDDNSSAPKGMMRVYQQGERFFGRNEVRAATPGAELSCTRCKDERKDQPMAGLLIMRNMHLENGEYIGGDILDPSTGRVYGCKFHLTEGGHKMVLRGFLGIALLGGTQMWRRVEPPPQS
jgi:uncharacterized protein (DUF2147 family)